MVMPFHIYNDNFQGHEVEIEQTESNEFEIISAAKWDDLSLAFRMADSDTDDDWGALYKVNSFLTDIENNNNNNGTTHKASDKTDPPITPTLTETSSTLADNDKESTDDKKQADDPAKTRNRRVAIFCVFFVLFIIVAVVTSTGKTDPVNDDNENNAAIANNDTSTPVMTAQPQPQPTAPPAPGSTPAPSNPPVTPNPPPTPQPVVPNVAPPVLNSIPLVEDDDDDYTNPIIIIDSSTLNPATANMLAGRLQSMYSKYRMDASGLTSGQDTTPQRKALNWLTQDNPYFFNDQSVQMTRYALAVFYYATNAVPNEHSPDPDSWQIVTGWLSTTASHCTWYGIICNAQGKVESIELPLNSLSGSLPLELGFLGDTLLQIDITENQVMMYESDYDVFLNLGNLELLFANSNFFESTKGMPLQMAALKNLVMLELSFNILDGDLNSNTVLTNMPNLVLLEMEFNHFKGSIPYYFGQMNNLVYLYIRDNKFTGDMSFLNAGPLENLFTLWVERNEIGGPIPAGISTLKSLGSLGLSTNKMTGPIDVLGTLPQLQRVWIHDNQFSGTIPQSFQNFEDLEILVLHNNNLSGPMPQGVCNIMAGVTWSAEKRVTSDCYRTVQCNCCTECY